MKQKEKEKKNEKEKEKQKQKQKEKEKEKEKQKQKQKEKEKEKEKQKQKSSQKTNDSQGADISFHQDYLKYKLKEDIFRFPIINWNFRWQRPQQFCVKFAEDEHRVFYLSLTSHRINRKDATYEEISQKVEITQIQQNIWSVKLCTKNNLNPYQDQLKDPVDLQYLQWSVSFVKKQFHIGHTISIIDLPFWTPLALQLENNKIIYDCMDEHSGFSTNKPDMLNSEQLLINNAHLIVTSSQKLYDKVKFSNSSTVLIRNAVEYGHFSEPTRMLVLELEGINGPVIGYFGAISDWFDIKLIHFLAQRNENWTFVLIGNTFGCDIAIVEKLKNVIVTGEKPYAQLPQYLYRFDVCLIPFIVNNLTLATNPVKVYEYLASGKPVVAVNLPELEYISDLVCLASSPIEFEQAIRFSLSENDAEKINKRKNFAALNTWNSRYVDLKRIIQTEFSPKVSIIILTYNNWNITKQCLDSLFASNDYPNVEIIVVDNASTDETQSQLSQIQNINLKLYFSLNNHGYASGNALGCQAATGEYIILLNNDTILTNGWIQKLIKPLRDYPHIGITGPMSNSVGNEQNLNHFIGDAVYGADPTWLEQFYNQYKGRLLYTEMLGFFCVAIKREVYEKAGDLDPAYGIGMFEDDDYCQRVKQLGYKLAIVEDAFVYHHGSMSFKKLDKATYTGLWDKNKHYYEQKWQKEWSPWSQSKSH